MNKEIMAIKNNCDINHKGCWIWKKPRTTSVKPNSKPYGMILVNGKIKRAHRYVLEILRIKIEGLCVCHKCDETLCVNPDHLFVGTHIDNMMDKKIKGRQTKGTTNQNKGKTHCPKGHPYSGKNLIYEKTTNRRRCRACRNDRHRS